MIEQKTNTKAKIFGGMFKYQGGIYQNALKDLTDERALKRPSDKSNHTNWLLGHILHCRFMLANMIGVKTENPFGKMYWNAIVDKGYPTVKEVVDNFLKLNDELLDKLDGMSDSELDAKPAADKPSLTDVISFFVYHEAYHLGQLGYARKIIGLEALKSH